MVTAIASSGPHRAYPNRAVLLEPSIILAPALRKIKQNSKKQLIRPVPCDNIESHSSIFASLARRANREILFLPRGSPTRFTIAASAVVLVLTTGSVHADTIPVGILFFNNLNPAGPGSPGVNDFEIDNLTGSLFSLPPDFPVVDSLVFGSLQLMLSGSGGPQTIPVGDISPGFNTPSSLQFPDSFSFSEAVLQATLSQTSFALSDGTTFLANSSSLTATLDPASGPSLVPGQDFVVLSVSGEVASGVPEPRYGAYLLVLLGLAIGVIRSNRS